MNETELVTLTVASAEMISQFFSFALHDSTKKGM